MNLVWLESIRHTSVFWRVNRGIKSNKYLMGTRDFSFHVEEQARDEAMVEERQETPTKASSRMVKFDKHAHGWSWREELQGALEVHSQFVLRVKFKKLRKWNSLCAHCSFFLTKYLEENRTELQFCTALQWGFKLLVIWSLCAMRAKLLASSRWLRVSL